MPVSRTSVLPAHDFEDIDHAAAVAPLVVVPDEHLRHAAHGAGELGVDDGRVWVAHDVARHERVRAVLEDALQVVLRALADGFVDILGAGLLPEDSRDVGKRTRRGRDPNRESVEDAVQLREYLAHRLGGTGRRGNDVGRGAAGAAGILVGGVEDVLVVGVGVDGRHHGLLDAEGFVEHTHHGAQRVGGAGGVGEDLVGLGVVLLGVDAQHDVEVAVGRRGADQDLLGTGFDMHGGLVALREDAGRLDHDIDPQVAPGQVLRVALVGHPDLVTVDGQAVLVVTDLALKPTVVGVEAKEVGYRFVRHQVVDEQNVTGHSALVKDAEDLAANSSETVDTYLHSCLQTDAPVPSCEAGAHSFRNIPILTLFSGPGGYPGPTRGQAAPQCGHPAPVVCSRSSCLPVSG